MAGRPSRPPAVSGNAFMFSHVQCATKRSRHVEAQAEAMVATITIPSRQKRPALWRAPVEAGVKSQAFRPASCAFATFSRCATGNRTLKLRPRARSR